MSERDDDVFDDVMVVALAEASLRPDVAPSAGLRARILAQLAPPPIPDGFALSMVADDKWIPHLVPGIRMRILSVNRTSGYAMLLLDVQPGTRFPAHHHSGAEECYVVSGSVHTCGRRLGPGDFVHADGDTDHGELWTEEGCQVILVAPPEEHGISTSDRPS